MNRKEMLRLTSILAGATILTGCKPLLQATTQHEQFEIEPFRINFEKDQIRDLHRRIDAMKWPELPFETGWSAGTNDRILRDLVNYWRHEYDWFSIQENLNQLDHFHATIEGEKLHFVWYKDQRNEQNFPILLLHGWPSSFLEFTDAAPYIVSGIDNHKGFDLVVPSLPGFVFSDAPKTTGMHIGKIADRLHALMQKLGYDRYAVQGGDWGSTIAVEMTRKFPESVVGLHYVAVSSSKLPDKSEDKIEQDYIERFKKFNTVGRAYFDLQATKPQTLAYAHQDSPIGFLSWILEKYWSWTDHNQDLWNAIDKDDVLTTAMLYWLNGRILSSSRIYYETIHMLPKDWTAGPVTVPTGYSRFPMDFLSPPSTLANPDLTAKLEYYKEMPKGGHFPALEEPELWAKEVVSFFSMLK